MDYRPGDRVVYPMHGAGVIVAVEEREMTGEKQIYYVIRMPFDEMTLMVPCQSVQEVGLRPAIESGEAERVLAVLAEEVAEMPGNWSQRYRSNLEKIRTGDIYQVAEVVRNLAGRERAKGLSNGERRMLENARQILCSELALARGLTRQEVEELVRDRLGS